MPRSKRAQVVSLTQTRKKDKEFKRGLIEQVHEALDSFERVYVFKVDNSRTNVLQVVREHWQGSKLFFAKNKVVSVAMGKTHETEYKPGLCKLVKHLRGDCALLFTNVAHQEVLDYFRDYRVPEFARAGCIAPRDFVLKKGPLKDKPFSLEPTLRQLGLDTCLQNGVIHLINDCNVCSQGDKLTSHQCRTLKLFDEMFAEFRMHLMVCWSNADGELQIINSKSNEEIPQTDDMMIAG